MSIHGTKTVVGTVYGDSNCFEVKVKAPRFSIECIIICNRNGSFI